MKFLFDDWFKAIWVSLSVSKVDFMKTVKI
ncbi:hypothetical protein CLV57_1422 [Mucilaginibacter auburnensis]|uniref:Uncharacterized protein n=1 Tax=Mucilaginibacter auburnensis TaxID=1457233 RepID=A0A2H9VUD1_9SPHI|nr:hypothetical protein CLV57_1422 [Mucilaginibacter auburnensis]